MTTFSLSSNDLHLDSSGQIAIASGREAYGIIILSEIRTMAGELQLNIERGMPYMTTVFDSVKKIDQWKNAVRSRVDEFPFVKTIISFDAKIIEKTMNYKLVIETDDGTVVVEA